MNDRCFVHPSAGEKDTGTSSLIPAIKDGIKFNVYLKI